jgi:rubrerythrin
MINGHMDQRILKLKTVDEILRAALAKEQAAFDFYSELLNHTKIDLVRDLVALLKDEEQKHMRLIERKLTELTLGRDLPRE